MKVVRVDWMDSTSALAHWQPLEDLDLETYSPVEITSYGVVAYECDDFIILAQSYGRCPEQVCNFFTIPKGCIKKMREIDNIDERKEDSV